MSTVSIWAGARATTSVRCELCKTVFRASERCENYFHRQRLGGTTVLAVLFHGYHGHVAKHIAIHGVAEIGIGKSGS